MAVDVDLPNTATSVMNSELPLLAMCLRTPDTHTADNRIASHLSLASLRFWIPVSLPLAKDMLVTSNGAPLGHARNKETGDLDYDPSPRSGWVQLETSRSLSQRRLRSGSRVQAGTLMPEWLAF